MPGPYHVHTSTYIVCLVYSIMILLPRTDARAELRRVWLELARYIESNNNNGLAVTEWAENAYTVTKKGV